MSRRVVLPDGIRPAGVMIQDRRIVGIVAPSAIPAQIPVDDLGDLVLGPGLIDAHVHINEPGRTDWEGFESATKAAAAGGVTTLVDMPLNSSPVTTSVSALRAKRDAAAGKCRVDIGFYGGLVAGNADEIESLISAGVWGIKAFLCDSGLPEFSSALESDLRRAAPILAHFNRALLVHAELTDPKTQKPSNARSYQQYASSRPADWERAAILLLIEISRDYRCPIHIVHLANGDALPILEAAKADGLPITVETCPHYLHFCAEEIPDGDTRFKCAPPIRERRHRELLWEGLGRGIIDTIGSDHSPCPPELKRLETGEFSAAWGGIASLQLTLPIVWTNAKKRGLGMGSVFDWTATNPARLLRLESRKGRLAPGFDADIVVFDPESPWTVDCAALHHRYKLTPYENATLHGQVRRTYVQGRLVFENGDFNGPARGELIQS